MCELYVQLDSYKENIDVSRNKSVKHTQHGGYMIDRSDFEPELTQREVRDLADIKPEARSVFYTRVKREWLLKVTVFTVLLYAIEYVVFSFDIGWVYLLPVVPIFSYAHRLKWNRETNFGALAAAKLAQSRDWPTWQRNRDKQKEMQKIREKQRVK